MFPLRRFLRAKEVVYKSELAWGHVGPKPRNSPQFRRVIFLRLGANGRETMSEHLKDEIWDLAAGTIIAVSVVSGVAYVIASAIH